MKSLLSAARKALDESEFELALENCNLIIEQDPKNYHAHLFKGFAFSKTNKLDSAVEEFEIAVSLNPDIPLAYQGLISISQNEPQKLISYYKRLAQIYSKDQPQKYYELMIKMIDIYTGLKDFDSIILIWEKMLPRSQEYSILKDHIEFTTLEIWEFILKAATERDLYEYDKEWQIQKFRIQSKSMDLVRKDIEKEINLRSKVGEAIENILIRIEKGTSYYHSLCNQLIGFLYKHLQFNEIIQAKEKILERILQLCDIFHSIPHSQLEYLEPFRVEFELKDFRIDDYDLEIVERVQTGFKDIKFGLTCSFLRAIRQNSADIKNLIIRSDNLDGNDEFIFYQVMAVAFGRAGCDDQALEWAEKAQKCLLNLSNNTGIKFNRRFEELEYLKALVLCRLGGSYLAESLSIYHRLLEIDSLSRDALLGATEVMIKLKNWQAAAEYSQRCLENNGNDPQALLNRGWVAFYQKDLELALRLVNLSNELHRDADCLYKLGRIYWEMGGEYKNSKEYALSYFLQSAKENTSYAPSFCYLGFYYDLVENDHNRAIKCFQKAIQLDSSNADANKALVMLKLKERKESEAIEILHSFCGHYPRNDWAHKSLGVLLVNSGKYADAIFHFNQSLRYDSKNCSVWTLLGQALSHEGKYVAASKAFERALTFAEMEKEHVNISYRLSSVYLKLGEIVKAASEFQKLLKSIPNHFPTRLKLVETYMSLANEKRQSGSYAGYKEYLRCALEISIEGLKYPFKSVWLFRFIGRILTLFMKNGIICSSEILDTCLNSMNLFIRDTDEHFLQDCNISFASVSFGLLFECTVKTLVIAFREARELPDLQAFCLYDLALCFYFGYYMTEETNITLLKKAIQIIQICMEVLPDSDMFWNSAGVFLKSLDPARSQHCFIKSAQFANSEHAWVNLVLMAIKYDDLQLSQELVKIAIISYPENPKLWLSKTIISKYLHKNDKTILEHTFELSDGALPDVNFLYLEFLLSSNNLKSVESAISNVQKSVEFLPTDVGYINLLAMAYERLGNYRQSLSQLNTILTETKADERTLEVSLALRTNTARLLCMNSLYPSAMDIFESILENGAFDDSFNLIYLGICLFKLERFEECLKIMDLAIENSSDPSVESELLITLGRIIFNVDEIDGNFELAKEQFFKCITHDISNTDALFGILAVAIVLNDPLISESVLQELENCQTYSTDVSYWIGAYHELNGNIRDSRSNYLKSCHHFPTLATSWNHLLRFCLMEDPNAAEYALKSLNIIFESNNFPGDVDIHVEKLYLEGLFLYCSGLMQDARSSLIKALHFRPQTPKILATLYLCEKNISSRIRIREQLEALSQLGFTKANHYLQEIQLEVGSDIERNAESFIAQLRSTQDQTVNLKLSIVLFNKGDYESALAFVKKYLEVNQNDIKGLEVLVAVLANLKLWSEVESAYQLALNIQKRPVEKVVILYRLLKHYMELGDYKNSSETLTKIYELEGESSMQKLIQAIMQKRNGNLIKSQKILDSIEVHYRKWADLI